MRIIEIAGNEILLEHISSISPVTTYHPNKATKFGSRPNRDVRLFEFSIDLVSGKTINIRGSDEDWVDKQRETAVFWFKNPGAA